LTYLDTTLPPKKSFNEVDFEIYLKNQLLSLYILPSYSGLFQYEYAFTFTSNKRVNALKTTYYYSTQKLEIELKKMSY